MPYGNELTIGHRVSLTVHGGKHTNKISNKISSMQGTGALGLTAEHPSCALHLLTRPA